jgi:hypothetical protein
LTIAGEPWLAHEDAVRDGMTVVGGACGTAQPPAGYQPPASPDVADLLGTFVRDEAALEPGFTAQTPLPNGRYDVYLWCAEPEADGSRRARVKIQKQTVARGLGWLPVGHWGAYGPYPAAVTDGTLSVEVLPEEETDTPLLSGIAAYRVPSVAGAEDSLTLSLLGR